MRLYKRPGTDVWQCAFTVNGRPFRRSTGQVQKTAAKLVANDLYHAATTAAPVGNRWRVAHLTGTWFDAVGQSRKDARNLVYQLDNINRLLGEATFVDALTAADIIQFRAKRRGEGVAAASVNRELSALRAAVLFCHRHYKISAPDIHWRELFLAEPANRLRFLDPTGDLPRVLAAADPEMRAMILLAVTTGLRRENVWALEWHQINLSQGLLAVTGKGNKSLSKKLVAQVIAALSTTPEAQRFGLLFPMPNKRRRWERLRRDAQLVDFRWHDLRHTFATWARHANIDIADLRDAMDHSSITTTMRYAHILPSAKRTAFDAVAEMLPPDPIPDATDDTTGEVA